MNDKKVQDYYKKLRSHKLGSPNFLDPLYVPYHTNKEISQLKTPFSINTGYPLVDPYRSFMGKGLSYRSKYNGYCSYGYTNRVDKNSQIPTNPNGINTGMCYPNEEENENDINRIRTSLPNNTLLVDFPPLNGTFYSSINSPKSYTMGYGVYEHSPRQYANRAYNSNCNPTVGGVRASNGLNDKGREENYQCQMENFW